MVANGRWDLIPSLKGETTKPSGTERNLDGPERLQDKFNPSHNEKGRVIYEKNEIKLLRADKKLVSK